MSRDHARAGDGAARRGRGRHGPHGLARRHRRLLPRILRLPAARRRAVRDASEPAARRDCVEGSEENNYLSYTIELTDLGRRHPITEGIDDFELTTEQYWVLHDDLIDVLATTTHPVQPWHPWHRPITSPAIWTRLWGDGRIVVTTPGHSPDILAGPERPHHHRKGHAVGHPHRIGIVGLGVISRQYLETLAGVPSVRITAVADLDRARAEARRRRAARCPGAGRRRAARAAPRSTPSST